MPDFRTAIDRIHYENRRGYTKKRGNISYLDGTPLSRPFDMPRAQRIIALVIVAVAVVIGFALVNNLVIARFQAAADEEKAVIENLARGSSIETIPNVASLIGLDNDGIKAAFAESGYTIYDATKQDDSTDMVLYRIPPDMDLSEAAVLYGRGVGSLDAADASRLLNGSWYFAVDRVNGTSMVVRYADFTSGDPEVAVHDAIAKEGFSAESITDSGVDDSGNTYSMGTLDAGGTTCTWKVSALPLKEMYSIAGLPENACYVGVRVTVA